MSPKESAEHYFDDKSQSPDRPQVAHELATNPTQEKVEAAIRAGHISVTEAVDFAFRVGFAEGHHKQQQTPHLSGGAPTGLPHEEENRNNGVDPHNRIAVMRTELYLKGPLLPNGI